MANVNRVFGFKPVSTLGQSDYCGRTMSCYKAAGTSVTHDLAIGDPVRPNGTVGASADGLPAVMLAANTGNILGVVVGFEFVIGALERTFIDGADEATVLVDVDPMTVYETQSDAAIPVTSVWRCGPCVVATANRVNGISQCKLGVLQNDGTIDQFMVIGFPKREDNEINAAYNKVYVKINQSTFVTGVVGTA
jgi:hypothetical protein